MSFPKLVSWDWIIDAHYAVDLNGGREAGLVSLVKKSIHCHQGTEESAVLLVGFLAVGGAGGITRTAIPINRRDHLGKYIEKREKKR
jgi:hypothetical protein